MQAPESPAEIWLKLECLQPIGTFKIRGAANAIRSAPPGAIAGGVLTTSAGNMAQGVAWIAREEGVPAPVGAPLAASLAAGEPVGVDYTASFVGGAGGKALLPAMWERARPLVSGAVTLTFEETASAVRLLADRMRVVSSGCVRGLRPGARMRA